MGEDAVVNWPLPFKEWFLEVSPMVEAFDFPLEALPVVYYETYASDGKEEYVMGRDTNDLVVHHVYIKEGYLRNG